MQQIHFKVVYSECEAIITQCECASCIKDIRIVTCDDCKEKQQKWNKLEK